MYCINLHPRSEVATLTPCLWKQNMTAFYRRLVSGPVFWEYYSDMRWDNEKTRMDPFRKKKKKDLKVAREVDVVAYCTTKCHEWRLFWSNLTCCFFSGLVDFFFYSLEKFSDVCKRIWLFSQLLLILCTHPSPLAKLQYLITYLFQSHVLFILKKITHNNIIDKFQIRFPHIKSLLTNSPQNYAINQRLLRKIWLLKINSVSYSRFLNN